MEDIIKTEQKKQLKLIPLKIISVAVYLLALIFLFIMLSSVIKDKAENGLVIAVYLIISITYFAFSFGASFVVSLVGLIISIVKRKTYLAKSSIVFFAIFTALPVVTYFLNILLTAVLAN
ncbi:MAG: hypothetical protein IJC87_00340 [Clostridia bacterium]|nr:hypothetical protein [Clostridia bacterium]